MTGASKRLAFLGMGLLGSNFVRALRGRGEEVRVWNRSPGKARAVAAETGATAFDDPAEAVRGAARVHLALTDDAAVDATLEAVRAGLAPNVAIVDHTTTSREGAIARTARCTALGFAFQHAPVFMGPGNAREATGIMLASGSRALFDRLEPELARMTGKLVHVGDAPGLAAAYKLLGNQFLVAMTAGLADTFALAKGMGLSTADVEGLFGFFNPASSLGPRMKRLLAADYGNPSWGLAMARKDTRLMIEAARAGGVELAVMNAIAAEMDRWIAKGHAADDWTVIAKDAVR
ncbi:MAG: NAD(P)-dependent oxidoreductase [Anaeromyxobacteraceae bacterium]